MLFKLTVARNCPYWQKNHSVGTWAIVHIVSVVRKQREMNSGAQLVVFLFSLGPQPTKKCCLHFGWVSCLR